jgi:hypothetical protein
MDVRTQRKRRHTRPLDDLEQQQTHNERWENAPNSPESTTPLEATTGPQGRAWPRICVRVGTV